MKKSAYLKHDATASGNPKLMVLLSKEGAKGYGLYWLLLEWLRQQDGFTAPMDCLGMLAYKVGTSRSVLERIVLQYGLFVVRQGQFHSPGMVHRLATLLLAQATGSNGGTPQAPPANSPNCLIASDDSDPNARKGEKIDRREEKRGGEDSPHILTPCEVRKFVSGVDHWERYIDEAFGDRSWLEVVAMHSGMKQGFLDNLPDIIGFFKQHVRTYGKEPTLCSVADAKSYFGNFIRQASPTQKALQAALHRQSALKAEEDPYRYEDRDLATGQRTYCGGQPIPANAAPRPDAFAVWDGARSQWGK